MADFIGFYLDGIHSSTYGILRVSDGDRYKEGLIPEFEDREIELSGGSGSIYVNTQYKKTPFDIEIAFDHLTEQQFRDMRKWLGGEKLHSFRFDERPYKTYWVKLESRPELEYVCFMEESKEVIGQEERIYKGEGTLSFVAYDPFGYCIDNSTQMTETGLEKVINGINWQVLDSYSPFTVLDNNVDEWGLVSGLKNKVQLSEYNVFTKETSGETTDYIAKIYNPGDFETDFELFVKLTEQDDILNYLTFELNEGIEYLEGWEELKNGFYTITDSDSELGGAITLPSHYNNLPVVAIDGAFKNNLKIIEVKLPETMFSIGGFSGCENLEKVLMPKKAFEIASSAFQGCKKLIRINIPKGVLSIKSGAFSETGLTVIKIPDEVADIGAYAFMDCLNLKVAAIGQGKINEDFGFTETVLEAGLFAGCKNLTHLKIGENWDKIRYDAFTDCSSLSYLICESKTPPILEIDSSTDTPNPPFLNVPSNCKIYVPRDSLNAYKAADYWKDRANYILPLDEIEEEVLSVFDIEEEEDIDDPVFNDYNLTIQIEQDNENPQFFIFSLKELETTDNVLLNTKKHSLTIYHFNKTKSLRYDLIKSTHWPKIPIGESTIKITCGLSNLVPQIKYNYKYY